MKTKLILLLFTVILSSSLFAQVSKPKVDPTPQKVAEKMTAAIKGILSLTPAQEKKVYEINLEYARKQAELKKLRVELNKKHDADLEAIYTTEQKAKIAEMKIAKQKEQQERANDPNVQKIMIKQ